MYNVVGSLTYTNWQEFAQEFIAEFWPKNEVQMLQMDLETATYFQGSTSMLMVSRRSWTRPIILREHTLSSSFIRA
jgi:hypothetical protein